MKNKIIKACIIVTMLSFGFIGGTLSQNAVDAKKLEAYNLTQNIKDLQPIKLEGVERFLEAYENTNIVAETNSKSNENEIVWQKAVVTAYCPCAKCCGKWAYNRPNGVVYTASGAVAKEGVTIGADFKKFKAGTKIELKGYGVYVVQDTGSGLKNKNKAHFDMYMTTHQKALNWGRKNIEYRVVE